MPRNNRHSLAQLRHQHNLLKQQQYRAVNQYNNLGQIRARDDGSCGSGGCNQFNYEWDTHAWDNLMGNDLKVHLENLPTMMRGAKVTRN